MSKALLLGFVAVCSCMGMTLCYGSVAFNNAGFGGFGYYPAYPASGSNLGLFGGALSSAIGGGLFGTIIHLFLFVFVIQLLFPSNGGGILGQSYTH